MKRFVLGTNRTTAEQDTAFFTILRTRWPNLGWWHQLGETWLFIDATDTITVEDLRDAAKGAFPGISLIVVEAKGQHKWAGFGVGSSFEWMATNWDREG